MIEGPSNIPPTKDPTLSLPLSLCVYIYVYTYIHIYSYTCLCALLSAIQYTTYNMDGGLCL